MDVHSLGLVLGQVQHELRAAQEKHPGWPTDPCRQACVVAEESGELVQAVLNMVEYSEWHEATELGLEEHNKKIDKEAIQVAAMAIRFLVNRRKSL